MRTEPQGRLAGLLLINKFITISAVFSIFIGIYQVLCTRFTLPMLSDWWESSETNLRMGIFFAVFCFALHKLTYIIGEIVGMIYLEKILAYFFDDKFISLKREKPTECIERKKLERIERKEQRKIEREWRKWTR